MHEKPFDWILKHKEYRQYGGGLSLKPTMSSAKGRGLAGVSKPDIF